jgi:hypothetical protein
MYITHKCTKVDYSNPIRTYVLIDSDFEETFEVCKDDINAVPEILIIKAYSKRNFCHFIPREIARFYNTLSAKRARSSIEHLNELSLDIKTWSNNVDKLMPKLNYIEKYLPCILHKMKQLQFGNKIKYGTKNI